VLRQRAAPACHSTRPSRVSARCAAASRGCAFPTRRSPSTARRPTDLTFAIGGPGNDLPQLLRPVIAGDGGVRVRASTAFLDGTVQARIGAAWRAGDDHPWTFDESAVSVPLGAGRLYASVERRHWGPSWTGSLILDAAARAVPAIGWRKDDGERFVSAPFSWLGPWRSDPLHRPALAGKRSRARQADRRTLPVHAARRPRDRPVADDAVGRQRPQRVVEVAAARALRPRQRRERRSVERAGQPARRLRRALHLSLGRGAKRVGLRPGDRRGRGEQPAEPLSRQRRHRSRAAIEGTAVRFFVERANTTADDAFHAPGLGTAYRHHVYTAGYTQLGDPLGHPIGGATRASPRPACTSIAAPGPRRDAASRLGLRDGAALAGRRQDLGARIELAWQVTPAARLGLA
jgi:hypothetical protein